MVRGLVKEILLALLFPFFKAHLLFIAMAVCIGSFNLYLQRYLDTAQKAVT